MFSLKLQHESNPPPGTRATGVLLAGLIVLGVSACGGGSGGGGGSSGGSGPGSDVQTLEFFNGSLYAVDPTSASTSSPILIDPNAATPDGMSNNVGAVSFISGTLSNTGISGLHVERLVYATTFGGLRQVDTGEAGSLGSIPTPAPVSSESTAFVVCSVRVGNDFDDPDNARLAYGVGIADCMAEDSYNWRLVEVSDGSGVDPRDFPGEPVSQLLDPADGSHAGWLTVDSGTLNRLAPDLSLQTTQPLIGVNTSVQELGFVANGVVFLEIDGSLYAFDPEDNDLMDLQYTFADPVSTLSLRFAIDPTRNEAFFVDDTTLYMTDHGNAPPGNDGVIARDEPSDLPSPQPLGQAKLLAIGTDHVVWSYLRDVDGDPTTFADQWTAVRMVDSDVGTGPGVDLEAIPSPEESLTVLDDTGQSFHTGDWVFYNVITAAPAPLATAVAREMDLNGDEERFEDARWIGADLKRTSVSTLGLNATLDHVYQLDGVGAPGTPIGGLPVLAVDAAAPASTTPDQLGTLPSDLLGVSFFPPGFGPFSLGVAISPDGSGGAETDILFIDRDSIGRVTSTDGTEEVPVFGF